MTRVTRSPAKREIHPKGTWGRRPSENLSVPHQPAVQPRTGAEQRSTWGDAQRAPDLPKPLHRVSRINEDSIACTIAIKQHRRKKGMQQIYHLAPAARWQAWPSDQPYL